MDVVFAAILNYTFVCHGFLHYSDRDQEFYQLISFLYGFIGSMNLLDQVATQLIREGVCINKLAMQAFGFEFKCNFYFAFGLQCE